MCSVDDDPSMISQAESEPEDDDPSPEVSLVAKPAIA